MSAASIDYTVHDRQIWEEELQDFVPRRVFDAHIHLFEPEHLTIGADTFWSRADLNTIQEWAGVLYPGRETHFLVLGTPDVHVDARRQSRWMRSQVEQDAQSRFNRLVTPECRLEDVRQDVLTESCVGLKPYRIYASGGDIHECRIQEFLTHEQMELANEHELWVTMHLSRHHGCADEQNLRDLKEYTTKRYPRIKWILAHCARSFTYWPIREAVAQLRDLPNIWYDVSAVTDIRPLITLFSKENPERIFYGSDGVDATYFRGQYVALGRAWQGLDTSRIELGFPHCDGRPILAIYEQLLSMKQAAEIAGLSRNDIDNIFWRNAQAAFGVRFAEDS